MRSCAAPMPISARARASWPAAEQAIRTLGDQRSVKQLADTTISVGNGRFVKLADPRDPRRL